MIPAECQCPMRAKHTDCWWNDETGMYTYLDYLPDKEVFTKIVV